MLTTPHRNANTTTSGPPIASFVIELPLKQIHLDWGVVPMFLVQFRRPLHACTQDGDCDVIEI
jgi:hypothetical protein